MRFHLCPLGVSQNESIHQKLESHQASKGNPDSQQTLAKTREIHAIFRTAAAVIGARRSSTPQVDREPLRQSRGGACRAGNADAVSLLGICSRTMRNVVGP